MSAADTCWHRKSSVFWMSSEAVAELQSMGFSEEQAAIALASSGGDVSHAVHLLLEQPQLAASAPPLPAPPPPKRTIAMTAAEEEKQLQQAIAASRIQATPPTFGMVIAASRPFGAAQKPAQKPAAPAAAPAATHSVGTAPQRAALAAAEARLIGGGKLSQSPAATPSALPAAFSAAGFSATAGHAPPPRSLPPVALTGSVEERVQQCAARLAGRAEALDVLVASMTRLIEHPDEEKYRRVNPSNPAFARTVGATPGGVEFLMAVGYEPAHGQLVLQRRDPALLWLGKAALEASRSSEAYQSSKENQLVSHALEQSVVAFNEEDEKRRAAFQARLPAEPAEGAAGSTKLCVHLGVASHWRRFDSDSTLEDVLNYIRSLPGAPPREPSEWRLADVTLRPAKPLDASAQLGLTLKGLGLWPSGQVRCRADGQDEAFDAAIMGLVRLPSEDRA